MVTPSCKTTTTTTTVSTDNTTRQPEGSLGIVVPGTMKTQQRQVENTMQSVQQKNRQALSELTTLGKPKLISARGTVLLLRQCRDAMSGVFVPVDYTFGQFQTHIRELTDRVLKSRKDPLGSSKQANKKQY